MVSWSSIERPCRVRNQIDSICYRLTLGVKMPREALLRGAFCNYMFSLFILM